MTRRDPGNAYKAAYNATHIAAIAKADAMYAAMSDHLKESTLDAITWAHATMRDHEGAGHEFHVTAAGNRHPGMVVCSFAKPQWSSDHCSRPMGTGAEAIVMAVCEYLSGA